MALEMPREQVGRIGGGKGMAGYKVAEELQWLDDLKRRGAIAEEEFQKRRGALLLGIASSADDPPPGTSRANEVRYGAIAWIALFVLLAVLWAHFRVG